jgi:hypothetical protein
MKPTGLIRFSVKNFRAILSLAVEPNGNSFKVRGANGVGKSALVDSLYWGLGGSLDNVITNGAEQAETEIQYDEYVVTRKLKRGGRASLTVKDMDGRPFNKPTTLLSRFIGAIGRKTFSRMSPEDQAETLKRIAPGLDVSDLEAKREQLYRERTDIGRRRDELKAAASAMPDPAPVEPAGQEIPLAELRERRKAMMEHDARNNRFRSDLARAQSDAGRANREHAKAKQATEAAREALRLAEAAEAAALALVTKTFEAAQKLEELVSTLVNTDWKTLDTEEERIEKHNAGVRARQKLHDEAERRRQEKLQRLAAADQEAAKYQGYSEAIKKLDDEKTARLAAVKLPVPGLGLSGKTVTFDDGKHGPVPIADLNDAAMIRLDVVLGAALGHHLIAVRNASLLDADTLADVEAFAGSHGVQMIAEIVSTGEPLTAVIEEEEEAVESVHA